MMNACVEVDRQSDGNPSYTCRTRQARTYVVKMGKTTGKNMNLTKLAPCIIASEGNGANQLASQTVILTQIYNL